MSRLPSRVHLWPLLHPIQARRAREFDRWTRTQVLRARNDPDRLAAIEAMQPRRAVRGADGRYRVEKEKR